MRAVTRARTRAWFLSGRVSASEGAVSVPERNSSRRESPPRVGVLPPLGFCGRLHRPFICTVTGKHTGGRPERARGKTIFPIPVRGSVLFRATRYTSLPRPARLPEIINDLIGSGRDPGFSRRAGAPLKRRDAAVCCRELAINPDERNGAPRHRALPFHSRSATNVSPDAGEAFAKQARLLRGTSRTLSAPSMIPISGIVVVLGDRSDDVSRHLSLSLSLC